MLYVTTQSDGISIVLPSERKYVSQVVEICRTYIGDCEDGDPTDAVLICRELCTNAIVHGNRNAPNLPVTVKLISEGGGLFRIIVSDSGAGFDFRNVIDGTVVVGHQKIRSGYALVAALAKKIEFSQNGSVVAVDVQVGSQADRTASAEH